MNDTIAAISTALGVGAISIIRVSGEEAINIVNKIFKEKNLKKVNSHTINYGHIVDNNNIIDEVLVSVMKKPNTFTKEDVVEINCHGGIATTKKVLEIVLKNGARLAQPGEFTKRAFLNGRINLIEADAVMDLIESKTETARKASINSLEGKTSDKIKKLREQLVKIISNIEVNIDYPEYEDIEVVTIKKMKTTIKIIKNELVKIINESENGKIIKEGIKVLILGRPNVGKSSILNKLINEEKAIVTDIEGTTRDIVEGSINLDGIILNIIDTAGIRQTEDIIEKIGVNKSLNLIKEADLIILVLNNSEEIKKDDEEIINKIKDIKNIIYINKTDLNRKINLNKIKDKNIVFGNTVKDDGLNELKNKIKDMFNFEQIEQSDLSYLSNSWQISLMKEVLKNIKEIEDSIKKEIPIDMIETDLKKSWDILGEIIGETYSEELIDQIFSRFCLGK
ncbi:MAG: tRNA uridine-5-carboxymethylaminomethyl(34) synthesis GTPase MnmE [Bacilli bacterium]|nr:tRNA uridine-5-carboxymethylaminomethyl(34) synthesis GTPase MnmE [Bacilli bacterium]